MTAPQTTPSAAELFAHSPHALAVVEGPGHVVTYANPAFAALVGGRDCVGRPFAQAAPGTAVCVALLDKVRESGRAAGAAEVEHRPGPGRVAYWSYAAWPLAGPGESGLAVQVTDSTGAACERRLAAEVNEALLVSSVRQHELIDMIHEGERARRDLEGRMLRAQKLESLGVLAAGIAHDLNNILTPVVGFVEMAISELPPDSPAAPLLGEAMANSLRAADLVRQILAYAGKGPVHAEPLDVADLVRRMGALLGAAVAGRAALRYEFAAGNCPVVADAAQLRQVVLNLVTNAAEAAEAPGGVITVRVGPAEVAPNSVWSAHLKAHLPAGAYLALEVADTGCGMTPEVAARIFDPFFTTKFTGRGLGLAAVQGIALGHGGVVEVWSEPGAGSRFRLVLPSAAEAAPPPPAPEAPARWRGAGTVLVIDDEDAVRVITARILEHAGLGVLSAPDGPRGLEFARDHSRRIDAVVLDLAMPGMGGLEVLAALRELRPGLPVVLVSGYNEADTARRFGDHGAAGFVQKPFRPGDLAAAIRRALGQ